MKSIAVLIAVSALSLSALAKLPAPSDEAKAKAAEAAAKAAHAGKVDAYQLCKSQTASRPITAAAARRRASPWRPRLVPIPAPLSTSRPPPQRPPLHRQAKKRRRNPEPFGFQGQKGPDCARPALFVVMSHHV